MMLKTLGKFLRWIFSPLIAVLVLFEEWGWVPLSDLLSRLARWSVWARIESAIVRLPLWGALIVLLAPTVTLIPIKLLALYFLSRGQIVVGVSILISAKLLGTALLARLFQVTQPVLMQWHWFALWYPRWKAWKDTVINQARASALWRMGRSMKNSLRRSMRKLWSK